MLSFLTSLHPAVLLNRQNDLPYAALQLSFMIGITRPLQTSGAWPWVPLRPPGVHTCSLCRPPAAASASACPSALRAPAVLAAGTTHDPMLPECYREANSGAQRKVCLVNTLGASETGITGESKCFTKHCQTETHLQSWKSQPFQKQSSFGTGKRRYMATESLQHHQMKIARLVSISADKAAPCIARL